MARKPRRLVEALRVLADLGMPRPQQNDRSALCLLALLNLTRDREWQDAESPLMGITPIMDWSREHFNRRYAPNTRETFRRHSMHQFVDAGVALYNPDKPDRPVNSPAAVYRIEPGLLAVLRTFGGEDYSPRLADWLKTRQPLAARYAREREMQRVPVTVADGKEIRLSAGEHSELIKAIIEQFAPRFVPGGKLVYVGDTGDKWGYSTRRCWGASA